MSLGSAPLHSIAQDSFRANTTLPVNHDDPNTAGSLDTIPMGAEPIPISPLKVNPVTTIAPSSDNAASASEPEKVMDKESQNVSPTTSEETANPAGSVSPWENQVLGHRPENSDTLSAKEQNPSAMPSPWKTLLSLLIVLALIVGATYLFKRFSLNARRSSMPTGVEILARSNMNPKQSLCLVQLGNRLVLLGQSPNHISSLQTIDDPDEIAQILGQLEQKKTLSISNTFSKLFHREKEFYEYDENSAISLDIEDHQDQNQTTQPWCQAKGELSSLLDKVKGLSKIRFRS